MPQLPAAQRTIRARIGAHALHASHDSTSLTANARARFLARFIDEVDPNRELPEDERLRRADHARKAHFQRLALASAQKRAASRRARQNGGASC